MTQNGGNLDLALQRVASLWPDRPAQPLAETASPPKDETLLAELDGRARFHASPKALRLLSRTVLTTLGTVDHLRYWLAPLLAGCLRDGGVDPNDLARKLNHAEPTWFEWGIETQEAMEEVLASGLVDLALHPSVDMFSGHNREGPLSLALLLTRDMPEKITRLEPAEGSSAWFWLICTTPWLDETAGKFSYADGLAPTQVAFAHWSDYVLSDRVTSNAEALASAGDIETPDLDALNGSREWAMGLVG